MICTLFIPLFTSLAQAQDEVDLSELVPTKSYPYYEPILRQPLYLLIPMIALAFISVHLLKSTKRKPLSGRKPDVFFYPETERRREKRK